MIPSCIIKAFAHFSVVSRSAIDRLNRLRAHFLEDSDKNHFVRIFAKDRLILCWIYPCFVPMHPLSILNKQVGQPFSLPKLELPQCKPLHNLLLRLTVILPWPREILRFRFNPEPSSLISSVQNLNSLPSPTTSDSS